MFHIKKNNRESTLGSPGTHGKEAKDDPLENASWFQLTTYWEPTFGGE